MEGRGISFSKYSGCGNDFILIDNREKCFLDDVSPRVAALCRRRLGIGADGVILVEGGCSADFRVRIYNADGSEAEMCCNGLRCVMAFLRRLGCRAEGYTIETLAGCYPVAWHGEKVAVEFPPPKDVEWDIVVSVGGTDHNVHHIDTGVPHAVVVCDAVVSVPVELLGRAIRVHERFAPAGVNVDFVEVTEDGKATVRTYERGVEGETLACGTGATAAVLVVAVLLGLESPVTVRVQSGEELTVSFIHESSEFRALSCIGPVVHVYDGIIPAAIFSLPFLPLPAIVAQSSSLPRRCW